MKTIAILGANGQVGTEVCLFLKNMVDYKIIPICRSVSSAFILKKFNFEIRYGDISNPDEAKNLLFDCDYIVDFTLPSGSCSEIKDVTRKIIINSIQFGRSRGSYIYASTIMAFGMPMESKYFKHHVLSKTVYGYSKRYGEKLVAKLCKKYKKRFYILRLGEVHGAIQRVSKKIIQELKNEPTLIPDNISYTVFTFTIAEAIKNIIDEKESPGGLYTLVSKPEWTWKEVHEYYCKKAGINPEIKIVFTAEENILKRIKAKVIKLLNNNAQLISSYVISYFPVLEKLIAGIYYCKKAKNDINRKYDYFYSPFKDKFYIGKIPGKRMNLLSDSRDNMDTIMSKFEEELNQKTLEFL